MDNAAENNHLKTLEWLRGNRSEGWTIRAANAAARNGHLSALAYLLLGTKHETVDRYLGGGEFGVIGRSDTDCSVGGLDRRGERSDGGDEGGNGHQYVQGLQLAAGVFGVDVDPVDLYLNVLRCEVFLCACAPDTAFYSTEEVVYHGAFVVCVNTACCGTRYAPQCLGLLVCIQARHC